MDNEGSDVAKSAPDTYSGGAGAHAADMQAQAKVAIARVRWWEEVGRGGDGWTKRKNEPGRKRGREMGLEAGRLGHKQG